MALPVHARRRAWQAHRRRGRRGCEADHAPFRVARHRWRKSAIGALRHGCSETGRCPNLHATCTQLEPQRMRLQQVTAPSAFSSSETSTVIGRIP